MTLPSSYRSVIAASIVGIDREIQDCRKEFMKANEYNEWILIYRILKLKQVKDSLMKFIV